MELTVLFEPGVRLQEGGHRALEFHSLFLLLGHLLPPGFPAPLSAPVLSDRSEAETYGRRYGRLAPGAMRQLPTAASGLKALPDASLYCPRRRFSSGRR